MNYRDLLRDPKWQKKRLKIMERDNFQCQFCKSEINTLVVHHKKYINGRKPWEYDNEWLTTLCIYCHNHIHSHKDQPNINDEWRDFREWFYDIYMEIPGYECEFDAHVELYHQFEIDRSIEKFVDEVNQIHKKDAKKIIDMINIYSFPKVYSYDKK